MSDLPTSISSGDTGHIDDHESLHTQWNSFYNMADGAVVVRDGTAIGGWLEVIPSDTTVEHGLRWNPSTGAWDVGSDFIDNLGGVVSFQSDTRANQPAAGTVGRFYHVNDSTENVLEYDDGTSWVQIVDLTHRNDTNNPHSVTAAQAGAVATANVEAGTGTFSGDGTATTFTISHNLGATPTERAVWAESVDAAADHYISAVSSTGIDVTFLTAPASGTDNVVLGYSLRL